MELSFNIFVYVLVYDIRDTERPWCKAVSSSGYRSDAEAVTLLEVRLGLSEGN